MSLSNSQIKKIPEYENKTPISVLDGSGLYIIAKGKCKRFEGLELIFLYLITKNLLI